VALSWNLIIAACLMHCNWNDPNRSTLKMRCSLADMRCLPLSDLWQITLAGAAALLAAQCFTLGLTHNGPSVTSWANAVLSTSSSAAALSTSTAVACTEPVLFARLLSVVQLHRFAESVFLVLQVRVNLSHFAFAAVVRM